MPFTVNLFASGPPSLPPVTPYIILYSRRTLDPTYDLRFIVLHPTTGGFSYGHSGQQNPFRFTKGSASLIHMRL